MKDLFQQAAELPEVDELGKQVRHEDLFAKAASIPDKPDLFAEAAEIPEPGSGNALNYMQGSAGIGEAGTIAVPAPEGKVDLFAEAAAADHRDSVIPRWQDTLAPPETADLGETSKGIVKGAASTLFEIVAWPFRRLGDLSDVNPFRSDPSVPTFGKVATPIIEKAKEAVIGKPEEYEREANAMALPMLPLNIAAEAAGMLTEGAVSLTGKTISAISGEGTPRELAEKVAPFAGKLVETGVQVKGIKAAVRVGKALAGIQDVPNRLKFAERLREAEQKYAITKREITTKDGISMIQEAMKSPDNKIVDIEPYAREAGAPGPKPLGYRLIAPVEDAIKRVEGLLEKERDVAARKALSFKREGLREFREALVREGGVRAPGAARIVPERMNEITRRAAALDEQLGREMSSAYGDMITEPSLEKTGLSQEKEFLVREKPIVERGQTGFRGKKELLARRDAIDRQLKATEAKISGTDSVAESVTFTRQKQTLLEERGRIEDAIRESGLESTPMKAARPYEGVVYRGQRPQPADPGDFGVGKYYTENPHIAQVYGDLTEHTIRLKNPAYLSAGEVGRLSEQYGTIHGTKASRLDGARRLSEDFARRGHDGIVANWESRMEKTVLVFPEEMVKRLSPPIAPVSLERTKLQRGWDAWREFWHPYSTIPNWAQVIFERRSELFGPLGKANSIIEKLDDKLNVFPLAVRKDIFRYLDGQIGLEALPEEARATSGQMRRVSDMVGKMMVKRGIITQESFNRYAGHYVHYMYLRHILPENAVIIRTASGKMDLSETLRRNPNLSPAQRTALGLIDDAQIAVPVGLGRSLGDIVKHDYFTKIAENPDLSYQPSFTVVQSPVFGPQKIGIEALPDEINFYRQRLALEPNEPTAAHLRALEDTYTNAVGLKGETPRGYVRMGTSRGYGPLRGALVRKAIHDDLTPLVDSITNNPDAMLNGIEKIGAATMATFKIAKVPLNPPTVIRNAFSNILQMNMSGIPLRRIPDVMIEHLEGVIRKDQIARSFERNGGTQSTFAPAEINEILDAFRAMKGGALGNVIANLEGAAKYYGRIDDFYKGALYRDAIVNQGMSIGDAMNYAQKWGMDYSLAPRSIKAARRWVLPFVSYQYKVAPLIVETMAQRPWVLAKYAAVPYILFEATANKQNWSVQDRMEIAKELATRTETKGEFTLIPSKDERGQVRYFNYGFFTPWGNWWDMSDEAFHMNPIGVAKRFGVGGWWANYIAVMQQAQNDVTPPRDPYSGRDIYSPLDTPVDQIKKLLYWQWNMIAPSSIAKGFGAASKTYRAFTGEADRWGDIITPQEAFFGWIGVDLRAMNAGQAAAIKSYKIQELKAKAYQGLAEPGITDAERERLLFQLQNKSQEVIEPEISPLLKGLIKLHR